MRIENIRVLRADITTLAVDAVVNSANRSLLGGGGVDRAVHRAAGRELLWACADLGGCEVGKSKITPGFRLPSKYVIHTVAPAWTGGRRGEADLLESAYRSALDLALERDLKSIALSMLSRGIHRYPAEAAAEIAWNVALSHVFSGTVIFVPYAEEDDRLFSMISQRLRASPVPAVWVGNEAIPVTEDLAANLRALPRPEEPFETAAWMTGPDVVWRLTVEGLHRVRGSVFRGIAGCSAGDVDERIHHERERNREHHDCDEEVQELPS